MRRAVYRLMSRAGLPAVWRTLHPSGATILTYHGFTDEVSFGGVLDHQHMRLHVGAFRAHLEHLVAHYRVVSMSELVACYRARRASPKRAVAITFDDGYRSCYTLGYQVLKEFGAPAALFVVSDFVFAKQPLWHDRVEYAIDTARTSSVELELGSGTCVLRCETVADKISTLKTVFRFLKQTDQRKRDTTVRDLERRVGARLDLSSAPEAYAPVEVAELVDMARDGLVEVGCHTKSHAILSRCNGAELETEIVEAKHVIERALDRPCDLFCYPNGTAADFDDRTRTALVRAGFACALTTVSGKNDCASDPMKLRRVGAPRDLSEFALAASGLRSDLARAYHAGIDTFAHAREARERGV